MSTNNALLAMLGQYENNSNSYGKKTENKFNENNYFGTYLQDKQKTATKVVRIIPTTDGTTPFVEVWGHKVQVDGEWKTFACLQHEKGQDCPFCEAREALRATGSEADKELAKKYSARKMYIFKFIDRDNEDHGVKFWRFNDDFSKTGILDKIYGVIKTINKDITDVNTGRDLSIMIARDQNNNPVVQTITQLDASPLSEDATLAKSWIDDTRTWEDVYSVKTYDYLEIIVKGGVPVYSKEAKRYVDKSSLTAKDESAPLDTELSLGVSNVKSNVTAATTQTPATPAVAAPELVTADESDDLPF